MAFCHEPWGLVCLLRCLVQGVAVCTATCAQLHKRAEKITATLIERGGLNTGDNVVLLYPPGEPQRAKRCTLFLCRLSGFHLFLKKKKETCQVCIRQRVFVHIPFLHRRYWPDCCLLRLPLRRGDPRDREAAAPPESGCYAPHSPHDHRRECCLCCRNVKHNWCRICLWIESILGATQLPPITCLFCFFLSACKYWSTLKAECVFLPEWPCVLWCVSPPQVSKAACILTTQPLMRILRSREAAASVNVKTWPTIIDTGAERRRTFRPRTALRLRRRSRMELLPEFYTFL